MGDPEDVAPDQRQRPVLQFLHRGPGGPGRGNQRSDADAGHQGRLQAALLEGAQHADVGQPLEAAPAEHKAEGNRR
jgi:hypothetical protein